MSADDPKYINEKGSPLSSDPEDKSKGLSQRYTATKRISLWYLQAYRSNSKWEWKLAEQLDEELNKEKGRLYYSSCTIS